ncbi:pyridoxal 5'-phosphate synthase [Cellulomonas fimi]|uniref:pyridoxal 5'-phosphate synthase n=1 Tax=Cellulomonas fimi TaxID=1708 RepID=UPI00234C74E3|nr:pyridoxal 5'-phosphate synthase [Cellulomonas fimi]MDC7122481.1 pyridoxal 5'-phosphate synthase [Cellulomonas fimi]
MSPAHEPGEATLSGDTSLVLPEFDDPPREPMPLVRAWFDSARERGLREPFAATLATVDEHGDPRTRTVLLKTVDEHGLVFGSSTTSRKGRHLAARPRAALTVYWRETLQQVNVTGAVEVLPDDVADTLFARRTRDAQAATAASRQSRPLTSEPDLRAEAARLAAAEGPVVRPADWVAYRVVPDAVELWYGSPDRLHRRLQYVRMGATWEATRLQP